jgi:hypothetical protein
MPRLRGFYEVFSVMLANFPFRTVDPVAAREHALVWSYSSGKDAVILLDREALLVLIGPHKDYLRTREVLVRITPLGKTLSR